MQVTWSAVEAVLQAGVAGWRRSGRVWAGPCPVTGSGRDCCFFHQGPGDSVRGSCRRCHPLGRRGFAEHLEALAPGACAGAVGPAAIPGGVARRSQSGAGRSGPGPDVCRPSRIWEAAEPLAGTAGERYLADVRRVPPTGGWPPAVRFLRMGDALRLAVRPRPPVGCAGVVVYAFLGAGEDRCHAVQLEAVRADGRRLGFGRRRVMRVSAAGSLFAGGARVFEAAPGAQGACRVALAEGPVSALAVSLRFPFVAEDGWRVCGVAGWAGFTPAACAGAAEVVLLPDGDRDGRRAVARLAETLRAEVRTVWVSDQPDGRDVADLWVRCGPSGWRPRSDG